MGNEDFFIEATPGDLVEVVIHETEPMRLQTTASSLIRLVSDLSEQERYRLIVIVKEIIDTHIFTAVWHGEIIKCMAYPDTSNLIPGNVAIVTQLEGSSEYFYWESVSGISGVICIWSGSILMIPAGWQLCDGSNGTPDLRDSFIAGMLVDAEMGETGGQNTRDRGHNHNVSNAPVGYESSHTHPAPSVTTGQAGTGWHLPPWANAGLPHTHTVSSDVPSSGSAHRHVINGWTSTYNNVIEARPPYYALCYIQAITGKVAVPIGGIVMWSGTIANIPTGFQKCDGINSTPDLSYGFVIGAGIIPVGTFTGDADVGVVASHQHGSAGVLQNEAAHKHYVSQHNGGWYNPVGATGTASGVPPYGMVAPHRHLVPIIIYLAGDPHGHSWTMASLRPFLVDYDVWPKYYKLLYIQRLT